MKAPTKKLLLPGIISLLSIALISLCIWASPSPIPFEFLSGATVLQKGFNRLHYRPETESLREEYVESEVIYQLPIDFDTLNARASKELFRNGFQLSNAHRSLDSDASEYGRTAYSRFPVKDRVFILKHTGYSRPEQPGRYRPVNEPKKSWTRVIVHIWIHQSDFEIFLDKCREWIAALPGMKGVSRYS